MRYRKSHKFVLRFELSKFYFNVSDVFCKFEYFDQLFLYSNILFHGTIVLFIILYKILCDYHIRSN